MFVQPTNARGPFLFLLVSFMVIFMTASGGWFFYIFVGYFMRLRFFVRIFMLFDWIWNFILSTVSHILFVEKWKSLEEEGAENMQKKVGLNDSRVYFDMDGTIAKWRDVPVDETRKPGYYADLEPETELLDFMRDAMNRGENIYILSSYYTDTRALLEKKKWLNEINGNNGRFEGARVSSSEELRAVLDSAVERKAVGF